MHIIHHSSEVIAASRQQLHRWLARLLDEKFSLADPEKEEADLLTILGANPSQKIRLKTTLSSFFCKKIVWANLKPETKTTLLNTIQSVISELTQSESIDILACLASLQLNIEEDIRTEKVLTDLLANILKPSARFSFDEVLRIIASTAIIRADLITLSEEMFIALCLPLQQKANQLNMEIGEYIFTAFALSGIDFRLGPLEQYSFFMLIYRRLLSQGHPIAIDYSYADDREALGTCPILIIPLVDPVIAEDGSVYSREAVEVAVKKVNENRANAVAQAVKDGTEPKKFPAEGFAESMLNTCPLNPLRKAKVRWHGDRVLIGQELRDYPRLASYVNWHQASIMAFDRGMNPPVNLVVPVAVVPTPVSLALSSASQKPLGKEPL